MVKQLTKSDIREVVTEAIKPLDKRLGGVERRLDRVESRLTNVDKQVKETRKEMRKGHKDLAMRISRVATTSPTSRQFEELKTKVETYHPTS